MGTAPRRAWWWGDIPVPIQRSILFVMGLGFLAHEASLPAAEVSWPRLVVFTGMLGLPFTLKADEKRQDPPEDPE
jgi:hypothetical protein